MKSPEAPTNEQRVLTVLVRCAVVLALIVVGAQLWTSDLGMDERLVGTSRIVSEVDPRGASARAGISVGDEIVSDPGLEPLVAERTEREAYAWSYRLGRAMKQGVVPLRIRRGEVERSVSVIPDRAPSIPATLRQLSRLGTELPVAFAFLGVALLLARRPSRSQRDERARIDIAASFALLGASWVGAWPAPAWPLWLYPVTSLLEVFASACGVILLARFAWSYPTRSRLVDHRGVHFAILGIGVPSAFFSVLNSLHVIGAPAGLHGNTTNMAFTGALGLATLVGLTWQRRRAVDVIARRQATWLLAFCGVGIFIPVAFLLVPHYGFGLPAAPSLHIWLYPFPLLIPIGFAAVVTRYHLFSIDGVAARAVPYAIAVVTSLIVCLAVTLGIDALFTSHVGTAEASRWLGTIAALVVVEPLRRGTRILIDRAFSRDRDDFLRRCAELASRLAPMSDAQAIEDEVRTTLDAKVVQLLPLGEAVAEGAARAIDADLSRSGVVRVVDIRDLGAVDSLLDRGFELLVAVPAARSNGDDRARDRVLALTLPGGAHAVSPAERDALALVGRVIGAALARDVAWRMLETEVGRADDERRRITMELHDGIGATLAAARSMARRLRTQASTIEKRALDTLDETLRDGLGDLRTSLAGLDPTEAEWEALVANLRRHVGDHCAAEGIAFTLQSEGNGATRLSPAARLTVLRVIQEAVSNAVRHGAPKHVRVRMDLGATGVEVAVDDDGIGGATQGAFGRGLGNMARRVESLAGELRVDSIAPHGTRVSMSLPASAVILAPIASAEHQLP